MKKSLILLFFINFNIQASSNLRVNWEIPKVADCKKAIEQGRDSCNSQVDLDHLHNLINYIYAELRHGFEPDDQISINPIYTELQHGFEPAFKININPRFSDYISKLRLTNNDTREIVLSLEQEVSIFAFIEEMHLRNKQFFLKKKDVKVLLKTACKNCAISTKSADTIMSYLSAAYVNLID